MWGKWDFESPGDMIYGRWGEGESEGGLKGEREGVGEGTEGNGKEGCMLGPFLWMSNLLLVVVASSLTMAGTGILYNWTQR